MTSGTTILLPVSSNEAFAPIVPDDSYFSLALHNAQVYVSLPWLTQVGYLICSTEVRSSFLPNQTLQGIHQVSTIRKNTPSTLGLSVMLTDWLPAAPDANVRITLRLMVVRDKPFGKLTDKLGELGLSSVFSLVAPQISEGIKIAGIVGAILSSVMDEGQEDSMLTLTADLPVQDLKAGYWAVVAPNPPGDMPRVVRITADGRLDDPKGPFSERHTYIVLKVRSRERRGTEAARTTPWWGLLQDGLRQLRRLDAFSTNEERMGARRFWRDTIERAERLAEADQSFLLNEVRQIFQQHTQEALNLLQPVVLGGGVATEAAARTFDVEDDLYTLLGISNMSALDAAVSSYEQTLARCASE